MLQISHNEQETILMELQANYTLEYLNDFERYKENKNEYEQMINDYKQNLNTL